MDSRESIESTTMTEPNPEPQARARRRARRSRSPGERAQTAGKRRAVGNVQLKGLNAYYGATHAVRGVSLDFDADRVTAIIGPSGCGKSTMVRCINRMHEEIPGASARARSCSTSSTSTTARSTSSRCAARSAWSSRSRIRSRRCR